MEFQRVVSLSPSITETIYALGAGERVAGVTDTCDYPFEVNSKPHVCSWFDPDMDRLEALKPDLVLGLQTAHDRLTPVFTSMGIQVELFNPITIYDVFTDMLRLGDLLRVATNAQSLVDSLLYRLAKLDESVERIPPNPKLTVCRVLDVDEDELIVAGPQSFQYHVIARAGGVNVTSSFEVAYPKVTFQQMKKWDAQMIFVCGSDENYISCLKDDPKWQAFSAVKHNRLYQFDCGMTCRTSPRIVDMAELLFHTLYG